MSWIMAAGASVLTLVGTVIAQIIGTQRHNIVLLQRNVPTNTGATPHARDKVPARVDFTLKVSKRLRARILEGSLLCNVNRHLEVAVANHVGDSCPRPIGLMVGKLQK
jgi:hypothetical protein